MVDKIVYEYLMSFTVPIIKICPRYTSVRSNEENHCVSEFSYPTKVALCEGDVVMLLKMVLWNITL